METTTYMRRPFYVEAVRVTEENFDQVAEWCGGETHVVNAKGKKSQYIKVDVKTALEERQSRARIGDWVLFTNKNFRVYTDRAFQKTFDVPEEARNADATVVLTDAEPLEA